MLIAIAINYKQHAMRLKSDQLFYQKAKLKIYSLRQAHQKTSNLGSLNKEKETKP